MSREGKSFDVSHRIAEPRYGFDLIATDLRTKIMNMHLHRVAFDLLLPSLETRFEIVFRKHDARSIHECGQCSEFTPRQTGLLAIGLDFHL
jgi:hypothetical protein